MILKRFKSPYLRYPLIICITLVLLVFLFFMTVYFGAWGKIPSQADLSNFEYQRATEVYSSDSVLIGKYFLLDRQPVPFEVMPETLIQALVSIEDERFYDHSGIDLPSLFRVAIKSILLGDKSAGGGSTLTQQLAKNLYPRKDRENSMLAVHKIKEMVMASRLEDNYSKEKILGHYLNTVSFGDNTFGIESAALKFFNKSTPHLKLEEAAVLVGMLKATYSYNPRVFSKRSTGRRNLVLQAMSNNDFLTERQKDSLIAIPLKLDYRKYDYSAGLAPYFREEVRKKLIKWSSKQKEEGNDYNIYTDGLKVYTTLNYKMQRTAEQVMRKHMKSLQAQFEKSYGKNAPWQTNKKIIDKAIQQTSSYKRLITTGLSQEQAYDSLSLKRNMTLADWDGDKTIAASTIDSVKHYMKFLNTGSLAIDTKTGAVRTWIGGIDFKNFKFDHVAQSKRQVGSTFKPIVYTAALEVGIPPCAYFSASEVEYENLKGWSPSNSGGKDETYLNYSMKESLSKSVNTVAVKVMEATGIENVITQAKKMGVFSKLPEQPSLALGTGEIYANELAGVYASYMNDGMAVLPYLIETITAQNDSILEVFEPKRAVNRAFSKQTGQIMLEMMKATVDSGTASRIRTTYKMKNDIAGKTGTTQNNKDAWFVALTPKLVSVTWVGLDNHEIGFKNTSLGQGANAALPLFALWYKELGKDAEFNKITKARFEKPSNYVLDQLDCDPVKRDGFFKRLFKNPDKKKIKEFVRQSK